LSDFNEASNFSTDFEKYTNIKCQENPSRGSRVVPYGQTDGQIRRNLTVDFRNFANALTVLEVFVDKVLNEIHGTIYSAHGSEVEEPQRVSYGKMKVRC